MLLILTYKHWNHDLRVCEEYDETDAHLQVVEHLCAVVGHVQEAEADEDAAQYMMEKLYPKP